MEFNVSPINASALYAGIIIETKGCDSIAMKISSPALSLLTEQRLNILRPWQGRFNSWNILFRDHENRVFASQNFDEDAGAPQDFLTSSQEKSRTRCHVRDFL